MVNNSDKESLFRNIDCIRIPVSNLKDSLKFYRDKLGHKLIWRKESSIGLEIPESKAELVIHTEQDEPEIDIKVKSVEHATKQFIEAGGTIVKEPFDIPIGKCVILMDPWGNKFVLLETSKGIFKTDSNAAKNLGVVIRSGEMENLKKGFAVASIYDMSQLKILKFPTNPVISAIVVPKCTVILSDCRI